jgi:hypothetical protein
VLLLALGACSRPAAPHHPDLEIERLADPWAEWSFQRHLERSDDPFTVVGTIDHRGRIFTIGWDEPVEKIHRVLPDYGLYANPIP